MSGVNRFQNSIERTYFAFQGYDSTNSPSDGKICYEDPKKTPDKIDQVEQRFSYETIKDNFGVMSEAASYAILSYLDAKDNNNNEADGYIDVYYLLSYATKIAENESYANAELDNLKDYLETVGKNSEKIAKSGGNPDYFTEESIKELQNHAKF